ncbi:MAG: hypothetical protein AAFO63_01665 [Pseudomonadota bacterium]
MGHNDHIDFELYELLTDAIDGGYLDEEEDKNAIGVARQVMHGSYDGLSAKQKYLYDKVVVPALDTCSK